MVSVSIVRFGTGDDDTDTGNTLVGDVAARGVSKSNAAGLVQFGGAVSPYWRCWVSLLRARVSGRF